MNDLLIFLLGGYFVPAVYFGVKVFLDDCNDETATLADHVMTGILAGLAWPVAPQRFEPMDDDDHPY